MHYKEKAHLENFGITRYQQNHISSHLIITHRKFQPKKVQQMKQNDFVQNSNDENNLILQLIICLYFSKIKIQITADPAMSNPQKNNKKITDYFNLKKIRHPLNKVLDRPGISPIHSANTKYSNDQHKGRGKSSNKREVQLQVQSNGTEIIEQSENRANNKIYSCKQEIMIGPCDVNYFSGAQYKLKKVLQQYSKQNFLKYLLGNTKFHSTDNLVILIDIKDEHFWNKTLPKMIEYALSTDRQKSISSCISMMVTGFSNIIQISKAQILMILINMFLCMLPAQSHKKYLSFAWLMGTREKDRQSTILVKVQKLKCFINYFNVMMSREYRELSKEMVNFQKVATTLNTKSLRQVDENMSSVQIERGYIEQHYKQSIMIDFSNKHIGGGVLTNGAVQQQILFCIFPQLVAATCLCDEIKDNQAVVITNAERINKYSGYSDSFTFQGTYDQKDEGPFASTIVAIDAIDYNEKLGKELSQYTQSSIERELIKAISGIGGAELLADADMPVCTGRWGCGAFKGNIYLKFMIQWVACSLANRKMIYKAQDQTQQKQLKAMVKYMKKHMTSQIIQAISQFSSVLKKSKKMNFLQFLKKQIS